MDFKKKVSNFGVFNILIINEIILFIELNDVTADISYDLANTSFFRRGNLWLRPQVNKPEWKSQVVTQRLPSAEKHNHLQTPQMRPRSLPLEPDVCSLKPHPPLRIVMKCCVCSKDRTSVPSSREEKEKIKSLACDRALLLLHVGSHPENREVDRGWTGHGWGQPPPAICHCSFLCLLRAPASSMPPSQWG